MNLTQLVLKETTLSSWQDMTHLVIWMPKPGGGLKSLKVTLGSDEPATALDSTTHRMTGTRADRPELIARFPDLEELNSSPVS